MNIIKLNTIDINNVKLNCVGKSTNQSDNTSGGDNPPIGAIGIYIYDIDGKLTAPENWDSANNDKAVGVYIGTDVHRFVIAKEDATTSKVQWGGYRKSISGVPIVTQSSSAFTYFDGRTYTDKIINQLNGYTDSMGIVGAPAAEACANYIFPNGQNGYMGTAGEWRMVNANKLEITDAITKCGGTELSGEYLLSLQYSNTYCWKYSYIDVHFGRETRASTKNVRAFLAV